MSQGFNPTLPAFNDDLLSQIVRVQLNALDSCHSGTTPPNFPIVGKWWFDTSIPTDLRLKMYFDGVWQEIFRLTAQGLVFINDLATRFAVDYVEGNNPPPRAVLDVYGIDDAACFSHDLDEDIMFKTRPRSRLGVAGLKIWLFYLMSTAELAKVVRLRLDYLVHCLGEVYTGGTNYNITTDFSVNSVQNALSFVEFSIPAGRFVDDTVEVELRLTRFGTAAEDTHNGFFGLKDIWIIPL